MIDASNTIQRKSIEYIDGINTAVSANLAKNTELSYAINARSTSIGTITKRNGTRRLGDVIVGTTNYGLFYFENSGNNGFYRITAVGGVTSIYYLNSTANWTALSDSDSLRLWNLGDSTSQFDISNPSGTTFRYTYDGTGTDPDIDAHIRIGSQVVIAAQNFTAANNGTFTVTGVGAAYFEVTNGSGVVESNKTIGTGSITITANNFCSVAAEGQLFLTNGHHDNIYISGDDGTTVTSSDTATGHLYNSPKAYKVNYYKDRLYLGDYILGTKRYKNGVQMSSVPLGIVSLIDGDHAAASCVADAFINVTDTKYIYATDTIDVYRGNNKVADITIKSKTENSFQINAITFSGTYTTLNASDTVWVDGTYDGTTSKTFRWATNPESGINVKQYDTFKVAGGQNDPITLFTNIGDVMLIGNKHNLAVWNNYNLQNIDLNIGCVSDTGYVKNLGTLYFIHYTGIYSTTGGVPKLISNKVKKYIDGATKAGLEASAMGKKGLSIFAAIGDVTLYHPDGSTRETLTDVCLEYNLQQNNWFVHTGISATHFATYIRSDNVDSLEYASTETNYNIFELFHDSAAVDDEVTTNKEILFRIDTNNINLSKPFEKLVSPLEVIVETERGNTVEAFVSLDNGQFYALQGNAVKGCTIFKVKSKDINELALPKCRNIALSFRDYSKSLCQISRYAITYMPTNEEEEQRIDNYGK